MKIQYVYFILYSITCEYIQYYIPMFLYIRGYTSLVRYIYMNIVLKFLSVFIKNFSVLIFFSSFRLYFPFVERMWDRFSLCKSFFQLCSRLVATSCKCVGSYARPNLHKHRDVRKQINQRTECVCVCVRCACERERGREKYAKMFHL